MRLTGKLLVALPVLADGIFDRSVVLVLDHDDGGAVGVILNRPSDIDVAEPLPRWADLAAAPAVVFHGGPVQTELVLALATDGDDIGTIDLDADPSLLTATAVRVFAGYAGWSAGQLEGELLARAWVVADAEPDDAFRVHAEGLWSTVLARQPDPVLRRLAMLPDDPSVN